MSWSMSEFLSFIEVHCHGFCFVEMGAGTGLRSQESGSIVLYAMLEGSSRISTDTGETVELTRGDVAIVMSSDVNLIDNGCLGAAEMRDLPNCVADTRSPSTVWIGQGDSASRLLRSRLDVSWPGNVQPGSMPAIISIRALDVGIDLDRFARGVIDRNAVSLLAEAAATSLFNRMGRLLFVTALQNHPCCQALFDRVVDNPVAYVHQLIRHNPFKPWTVKMLANKADMGRSNFAARFSAQIGRAPMEVVLEERMKQAYGLLMNTHLKIEEVGERVGYKSKAAFISRFTDQFGLTPGKLRKREH
jgi:AraC-like DNA-binding protein